MTFDVGGYMVKSRRCLDPNVPDFSKLWCWTDQKDKNDLKIICKLNQRFINSKHKSKNFEYLEYLNGLNWQRIGLWEVNLDS